MEEIKKYRIIVTYYGTKMDVPYVRTKALFHGFEFPAYGELFHWDLYYTVRHKLQLSRNSLAVATAYLGIPGKTPLDAEVWNRAKYGDPEAIDLVVEHNIADVEIL
ncbi:ribonuclease H-like domain-containing protein, partial [Arthrospira platensis SPKY1]|nr:ribonuclease H-like domain-containing protein [Arthrospira platensis SPKY1]